MGQGFALSGAAGAMSDTLQDILKQKFLEQIARARLTEDARQADQRNATDVRQIEATESLRRATQDSLDRDRQERNQDRDAAREDLARSRKENQDLQAETRFQGRLRMLPKGARITGEQAVDFARYGASPMLKPATNSAGEPEFEFSGTQDANEAEARAAETIRYHNLLNSVAEGRLSVAQLQAEIAKMRAERPNQPQIFTGEDGKPRAVIFGPNGATEVPLPTGITGKATAQRPPQTPEEIEAAARARARGAATGKKDAGGGGLLEGITGLFAPKPAATVKMKAPNGQVKDVPADQVAFYESKGAKRVP
jgi:hypothetical protein